MDRMQATPRNPFLGGLADLLMSSYSPERTQQMQGLMNLLSVPAVARTVDRLSYGEPLTTGTGMTTALRPDTKETTAALLGLLPIGRAVEPAAVATGRALEPVAGRVAEAAYNRGGLAREMAMAMGQGTQSKIFIGPDAKTWDKDAAMRAANMERRGATPQEIWAATGTARGPDKMWRQEISDRGTTFRGAAEIDQERQKIQEQTRALREQVRPNRSGQQDLFPRQLTEARRPIRQEIESLENMVSRNYGYGSDPKFFGNFAPIAIDHPELFRAYPELKNVVVRQGNDDGPGSLGMYGDKQLDVFREAFYQPEGPKSTALHEMQHAVQDVEKFAPGGNPSMMSSLGGRAMDRVVEINDEMYGLAGVMDNALLPESRRAAAKARYQELMKEREAIRPVAQGRYKPFDTYRSLTGEAEARLVQRRLDLTPEQRRQNFPFQYTGDKGLGLDIPIDELINLNPVQATGLMGNIGR
jgi:hypothetical protein